MAGRGSKTYYVVWVWSELQGLWLRFVTQRQVSRAIKQAQEAQAFWSSVMVTRGEKRLVWEAT